MEEVVGYLFNLQVEAVPQAAPVVDEDGAPVDLVAAVKRYHDAELEAEAAAARKQLHIGATGLTDKAKPAPAKGSKRPAKAAAVVADADETVEDEPLASTARTPSPKTTRPGTQGRRNTKKRR